jgi:hypothetical protein
VIYDSCFLYQVICIPENHFVEKYEMHVLKVHFSKNNQVLSVAIAKRLLTKLSVLSMEDSHCNGPEYKKKKDETLLYHVA